MKIAKSLHHSDVNENDVVSIISENCIEFIGISFGTMLINAQLAPVNYNYTKSKIFNEFCDVSLHERI